VRRLARRQVLAAAGLVCGAAAPALPVPPGARLAFRIMRSGTRIGTHALDFNRDGTRLAITVAVEIVVRFAYVPVFRYTHHVLEQWDAGQLIGFDANTDHDGSRQHAAARREAAGLVVEGTKATVDYRPGRYVAPPESLVGTHWNRRELDAPIINPETGRLDRPTIRDGGMVAAPLADGTTRQARRYVLSGDVHLALDYAADGQWVGLDFTGDDGSVVSYELL
jgi:hypothetical protein